MDMKQYKEYLVSIQGKLTTPQASGLYEDIRNRHTGNVVDAVMDVVNENVSLAPKGKGKKAAEALYKEEEASISSEQQEQVVFEYLHGYFGDELTEDTSDEEVLEAVKALNLICEDVNEYLSSDDGSMPNEHVVGYLNSYFDGKLTENTSDEDLEECIDYLNNLTSVVNNYFFEG